MHLLVRKISEYTHHDILLGVFATREHADCARNEYLADVVHGAADPWRDQSYREVSDDDVCILSSIKELEVAAQGARVFVVSSYAEGFGQTIRRFEALAASERTARAHAQALSSQQDGFPFHCEVDELVVGQLSRSPSGHTTEQR